MLVAELIAPREFRFVERRLSKTLGRAKSRCAWRPWGSAARTCIPIPKAPWATRPAEYPMVLGHEPAGTVVKTGRGRHRLGAGRPRGAGARAVLLPLRILPLRAPQYLRQHPLSEHPRQSPASSASRQPAGGQPVGMPAPCRWNRHRDRAAGGGPALHAVRRHQARRNGGGVRRRAYRPADRRLPEAGGRGPHLGGGTGGPPPRDGPAHGRRRNARPGPDGCRAPDSRRYRAAAAWIAPSTARPATRPPTRPSAARATAGAWCSPAFTRN